MEANDLSVCFCFSHNCVCPDNNDTNKTNSKASCELKVYKFDFHTVATGHTNVDVGRTSLLATTLSKILEFGVALHFPVNINQPSLSLSLANEKRFWETGIL